MYQVSDQVYVKRSSMIGIDYINLSASQMNEKILNDWINLNYIKKEVNQFFKIISK